MNPSLPHLIELQALDLKLTAIKQQERKIPTLIKAAEGPLQEASLRLTQLTESLEAVNKERRDQERDLEAHEAQIEKLRARLTELKTNKEYQAHLFEIEMANKKKGEIEERILLHMERIEQYQREAQQAQAKKTEAERLSAEEKTRLETQAVELAAELETMTRQHGEVAMLLEKGLLDRYTKLKAARKDLALAPVKNGTCSGCRLQIPPQLVAEVRRSDELQTCTFCHRILYWEGGLGSAQPSSAESLAQAESGVRETV